MYRPLAVLLAAHGLVHLMGFAKAFGYAQLPQLIQPISRPTGMCWLAAGLLVMASSVVMAGWPRRFWLIGAIALVASQLVILTAWRDAWAGTLVNAVLLVTVAYGWFIYGPRSFNAQFERDAAAAFARHVDAPAVTDADLADLPLPVQRYLRAAGVVGRPRVVNYRLRFRGQIRSGPESRWMSFDAVQQSFADPPSRLFLMHARKFMLPVEVFHRRIGGHATMQVKLFGAIAMVEARGEVLDRSETVTLFNDMCLLAPATLLDQAIEWEPIDAHATRARFTDGGHTIAATLVFGDDGLLANFISDDRSRSSMDGKTFTKLRFSTPARDYRDFGPARLMAHGEAHWLLPEGEFTYGEFDLKEVTYNVEGTWE